MPNRLTPGLVATTHFIHERRGEIPGHTPRSYIGHTGAVDTNLRYLHHEQNTGDLSLQALFDTPATVKISSTNVADDGNPVGTGAQTILLEGFDSSGEPQSETVTLDGTTEVVSANTYKFVERATVTAVGSGGSNAGVIWIGAGTVTAGVPATKYLSMEIGTNLSRGGSFYVPNGKTFYPVHFSIVLSDTAKNVNVRFSTYAGIEYEVYDAHFTGTSNIEQDINGFPGISENTILEVRANVTVAGGILTVTVDGIESDN